MLDGDRPLSDVAGLVGFILITGSGSPGPLSNMIVSIEQDVEWIADCVEYLRNHNLVAIEADATAELHWMVHVQEVVNGTLYLRADSWYLGANVPGKPRVFMPNLGGAGAYRNKCEAVAADGYRGFHLYAGANSDADGRRSSEIVSAAALSRGK